MKAKILTIVMCITMCMTVFAEGKAPTGMQGGSAQSGKQMEGSRCYKLMVCESDDNAIYEFNRGIGSGMGNRGFLADVLSSYRSTFQGQIISASEKLLTMGVNAIVSAAKDKRPDWQKAVNSESRFVRKLPMQMEILDFYKAPSTAGPLDPRDMLFNGFGCRQVIEYKESKDSTRQVEVFYVRCKVRTDSVGLARMLNHSKFEVYVDSLRFAPYLCDLPNDSLGVNVDSRIDFDFEKRENLTFNVDATITSSWINQAMQVYNDQQLGTFSISASIDPKVLDENNVFVYSHTLDGENGSKKVSVSGDCFLVPRSYVSQLNADGGNAYDSWGTGQYKVEMQITEACQLNNKYYQDDKKKWLKDKWQPEWKKIKSRKRSQSVWSQVLSAVSTEYAGTAWITTLIDPLKTVIVQTETGLLNGLGSGSTAVISTGSAGANTASGGATDGSMPTGGAPAGM